jgi:hypothetical protein
MRPPEAITELIVAMDGLLRVRWGSHVGKWVVDRVAVTPVNELKWLLRRRDRYAAWCKRSPEDAEKYRCDLASVLEEIVSAQDSPPRRVILVTTIIDMKVYDALCLGDIKRYGGYSRYADEAEREMDAEHEQSRLSYRSRVESVTHEAYGRGGIHDFLTSKKRAGVLGQLQRGEKTLTQILGLRSGQSVVGDTAPVSPARTRVLVDSFGRPLTAS